MTPPLSGRSIISTFCRIPDGRGSLVPLTFHREQERLLDAYDSVEPDGAPEFSELLCSWPKKSGKSTTAGALVIAGLLGDQSEPDREIIIVASDLQQSRDLVFASAVRFTRRHPWLSKHIKVKTNELIYNESVTDPKTGGRYQMSHIARAVPARDAASLHGGNQTLTVIDEAWTTTYATLEALARSATRRISRHVYFSYAGLKSQRHAGVPLWDLLERFKAGDPELFVSHLSGPTAWEHIPWITQRYVESQRKAFATVPSKFKRLIFNEWVAGDEDAFLTSEEIEARGWLAVKHAYAAHVSRGGAPMDYREFFRDRMIGNNFTARLAANRWADFNL